MAGCPENTPAFEFHLIPLESNANCGSTAPELKRGQYTLRLSFWSKDRLDESGRRVSPVQLSGTPTCSTEVKPGESVDLELDGSGNPYWVRIEAYDEGGLRFRGSQSMEIVDGSTGDIYLHPVGASTCTRLGAGQGRAFHSATLLPNGHVLILGGITGGRGDQKFYVEQSTNQPEAAQLLTTAEIYDPQAHRFESLSHNDLPANFAFHRTVLLPSPVAGPYRLLLVGGFDSNDNTLQIRGPGMGRGLPIFHFGPTVGTKSAASRIITYAPETKSLTSTLLPELVSRMFPAVKSRMVDDTLQIIVAGGASEYAKDVSGKEGFVDLAATEKSIQFFKHSTQDDNLILSENIALNHIRVGHDLALLGDPWPALIWGGRMHGDVTKGSGAYLLSGSPAIEVEDTGTWQAVAWHQLSAIGAAGKERPALASGGFILEEDDGLLGKARVANEFKRDTTTIAFDHALHLIERDNQKVSTSEVGQSSLASSYHHSLEVSDGSVLTTGGTDPGKEVGLIVTPRDRIEQSVMASNTVTTTGLGKLIIPRYGHQVTELRDGSFLITGGVVIADENNAKSAAAENTAEIFTLPGTPATDVGQAPGCTPIQSSSSAMKMLTGPSPRTIKGRFSFSTRPLSETSKARAFNASGAGSR